MVSLHKLAQGRAVCLLALAGLPFRIAAADVAVFDLNTAADDRTAVFAMPNAVVEFHAAGARAVRSSLGQLEAVAAGIWRWRAPATAGAFGEIEFSPNGSALPARAVNLFVLVPANESADGYVRDYRIDAYPAGRPGGVSVAYDPPDGFVEVTPANADRRVSTHFRIGQFVSKQAGGWPKYVVPGPRLYRKLEVLLDVVRARGHAVDTLHVMSGYRTPFYNRAIGNVPFSRHIYGDAADVFVDGDGDGNMDDLNGDGRVTTADAATLAAWLESVDAPADDTALTGGLGIYDETAYHGPFIHVDTRGYRARWGHADD